MRRAYLDGLIAAERAGTAEPPNPFFDGDAESFRRWLAAPPDGGGQGGHCRYVRATYALRDDLRAVFPEPDGAHAAALAAWVERDLAAQDPGWQAVRVHQGSPMLGASWTGP
jgi:hypothetical protein